MEWQLSEGFVPIKDFSYGSRHWGQTERPGKGI